MPGRGRVGGEAEPATTTALGQVDAIVAKNRNGPKGEVTLQFNSECVRFDNAPRGY
ncbi:hypothetical protein J0H58_28250 [bacterium]|nr:hypothetical protein [bacterium]